MICDRPAMLLHNPAILRVAIAMPGLSQESTTGRGLNEIQSFLDRLNTLPSPQDIQIQSVALEPDQTRPVLENWYGRDAELHQLTTWQSNPSTRLIEMIGLGRYGKSSLAAKWLESESVYAAFPQHIWVNFTLAYPFRVFALWLLRELGHPADETTDQPTLITLLIKHLSAQPTLVVLDNLETLTQDGNTFEAYQQFLVRWLESGHQSLVVITSREQPDLPPNLLRRRSQTLRLKGLTPAAAVDLLRDQGVQGNDPELLEFAELTAGTPCC